MMLPGLTVCRSGSFCIRVKSETSNSHHTVINRNKIYLPTETPKTRFASVKTKHTSTFFEGRHSSNRIGIC